MSKTIRIMTKNEIVNELLLHSKSDLCEIITRLMDDGAIDITDINASHIRHLNNILKEKESIIEAADECIYESVFTDSIGKPADNAGVIKKIRWMERVGGHNIDGIMKYFKDNVETKGKD